MIDIEICQGDLMDIPLRQQYLGGTDLVAISGLYPWKKAGDVWLEKVKGATFKGNAATQAGKDLEPVVAMRHARTMNERGVRCELGELTDPIFDPEFPFIAANPDRIYLNRKRIWEGKTAAEDQLYEKDSQWGEEGEGNKVPIYYYGQINHYIGMLNYEDGCLSCFFLGRSRIQREYPITFDQGLYDLLRKNGIDFWQTYIATKIQPPIEFFSPESVMKAIADSATPFGGKKGILLEGDELFKKWAYEYKELSDKIDALEGPKKMLGGKIANWISGNHGTKVVIPDLGSFTYQKPEPKPAYSETNFEEAWKQLPAKLTQKVPDHLIQDVLGLVGEIEKTCTTIVTPEPGTPRLCPRWK